MEIQDISRPISAPVILGTSRQGRASEHAAAFVFDQVSKRNDMATELVGRFVRERRAYAALALTADGCVVTSVSNDYGYESVFERQIEALGKPGDVALGITTSGSSANVVRALETARSLTLTTIALTGRDGGAAGRTADLHINVPSDSTPRVQEVHMTLLHIICDLVERELSAGD